jgi:chemotaxis response regulator CheB
MKIVIVEDADGMRRQIIQRCTASQNLKIVGLSATESDAVEMVSTMQPDVVLVDLALSVGDGLNLVKQVRAVSNHSVILALSQVEARHPHQAIPATDVTAKYQQSNDLNLLLTHLESLLKFEEQSVEQQRLDALKSLHVMDTPEEEVFDEITRLAGAIVDAPIALISLVDESRQWFKSHIGLNVRETPAQFRFANLPLNRPMCSWWKMLYWMNGLKIIRW